MYVDTHAHLYLDDFKEDMDAIMDRCFEEKVGRVYLPNIDSSTIDDLKALVKKFPTRCYGMMGLHPCYVKENFEQELEKIYTELCEGDYHAVGEIGIDLYWDKTFVENQKVAFDRQIDWAIDMNLPIVIHSRDSLEMTISMVEDRKSPDLKGIYHCYNGTIDQAKQIADMGFLIGIGGVLTFKNAGLDKMLEEIPLKHMVLETDAPYLTPAPYRGKRNESSYVSLVGKKLAAIKEVTEEEVMRITTSNANNIFSYTPL